MSLKQGAWKINENGAENPLNINAINQTTGDVEGSIGAAGGAGRFVGIWDETARTLTFRFPVSDPALLTPGEQPQPTRRFYKGFLFSTPRNPAPGQDVVWTLVGFVQVTDVPDAVDMGGNARRNVFGWFAQITEVA